MEKTKILSWPDFYRDRVRNREYDEYFRKKYARFLTEIILNIKRLSNLMSGEVVLKEEGCGIGSVVKNLSQFYPKLAKELTEEEINENAGDVTKIIFYLRRFLCVLPGPLCTDIRIPETIVRR